MENQNFKISAENYGLKIIYEFDRSDLTTEEAFNAMMNILIGLTYSEMQIKELIINLAEEYKKQE